MCKLIGPRDQELQAEVARQERHEQLRRDFAQLANRAGPYLERSLDAIHAVLSSSNVALEEQLKQLQKIESDLEAWRPNMTELERCCQVLNSFVVYKVVRFLPAITFQNHSCNEYFDQLSCA
ncbi:hypothetical protein AHF37_06438 [Paragonimus kellicotti]|nr:hypothetical protein AHF37_06438 [Paragonimus kellicotti]